MTEFSPLHVPVIPCDHPRARCSPSRSPPNRNHSYCNLFRCASRNKSVAIALPKVTVWLAIGQAINRGAAGRLRPRTALESAISWRSCGDWRHVRSAAFPRGGPREKSRHAVAEWLIVPLKPSQAPVSKSWLPAFYRFNVTRLVTSLILPSPSHKKGATDIVSVTPQ